MYQFCHTILSHESVSVVQDCGFQYLNIFLTTDQRAKSKRHFKCT